MIQHKDLSLNKSSLKQITIQKKLIFRGFKVAVLAVILTIKDCQDADTEYPIKHTRDVFNN